MEAGVLETCRKGLVTCELCQSMSQLTRFPAYQVINSCYPEEVVRHYSPCYSQQLLDKLDAIAAGPGPG